MRTFMALLLCLGLCTCAGRAVTTRPTPTTPTQRMTVRQRPAEENPLLEPLVVQLAETTRRCYGAFSMRRNGERPGGIILVQGMIAINGQLVDFQVSASTLTLKEPALLSCFRQEARRWRFPASRDPQPLPTQFTIPITLGSDGPPPSAPPLQPSPYPPPSTI